MHSNEARHTRRGHPFLRARPLQGWIHGDVDRGPRPAQALGQDHLDVGVHAARRGFPVADRQGHRVGGRLPRGGLAGRVGTGQQWPCGRLVCAAGLQAEGGVAGQVRLLRGDGRQEHPDPRRRGGHVLHKLPPGQNFRGVRGEGHPAAAFAVVPGFSTCSQCRAADEGQVAVLDHADGDPHSDGARHAERYRRGRKRQLPLRWPAVRHAGGGLRQW
mmetsp:Transcript_36372/g.82658  ORF Transcript_36372/g.82658 Transcript_36372/m.82658 type:complete len:216 (+) Transcript_36372:398-1045(+)